MKTLIVAIVALFILLLAPPHAPRAQTPATPTPSPTPPTQQPPTSGAYTTFLGEQPVGEETYTLARASDGATTTATADVTFAGNKTKTTTVVAKGKAV
ncbi:MAG TPA: hypothetical protein VFX96_07500, partial [Pyrinomonadaceae bacterium]|nr:hypothetical protein [Pyrinomonadaceae bacterium]